MKNPGTVRRLASGGWMADVTINGRRRQGRAPTKAAAQRKLAELIAEASGSPAGSGRLSRFSLAEARELTIRTHWAGTAWERTAAIYSQTLLDFWGPRTPLASLTVPEVDRLRQHLLRLGKRPSTVNRHVAVLSAMSKQAQLHGHIEQRLVMPPQLRELGARDRVLTEAEIAAFCRTFENLGEPTAADLLLFLVATAARWGEAERLRGEHVDLRRRTVTFTQTKNGTTRTIPLSARAHQAIEAHVPARAAHRVWPYTHSQFTRLWAYAKEANGLGHDEALVPHCTRHTAATRLAQAGVSLAQIQAYGGWASLKAVSRYLHVQTQRLSDCVEALDRVERIASP